MGERSAETDEHWRSLVRQRGNFQFVLALPKEAESAALVGRGRQVSRETVYLIVHRRAWLDERGPNLRLYYPKS